MSTDVTYRPGSWVAVGAESGWLLVDIDPSDPIVLQCWSLLRGEAQIDEILDAVLQRGLRAVSNFALMRVSGERRAVVVRGVARAVITTGRGDEQVSAAGIATWREQQLPADANAVLLTAGGDAEEGRLAPLSPGVTLASGIRVALTGTAPAGSAAQREPRSAAAPREGTGTVATGPTAKALNATSGPAAPAPPKQAPPEPAAEPAPSAQPTGAPAAYPPAERPAAPAPIPWMQQARPPAPQQPVPPPPGAPLAPPPAPAPGAPREEAWTPPPGTPPGSNGDSADSTVNRASLSGILDHSGGAASMVQAVRCQHGHLSPPMAVSCRVCGFPLMGQAPTSVPRPTLGVLRLSTGDVVPLDRSVVMGRNPKVDGANAAERPHIVRLPSPGHDISRTHLEIRLDGWHVLLTDLNSVNGTVVTPPWQEPQRLRPNEAVPIEPGTVVSLADEVTFRYEVTG